MRWFDLDPLVEDLCVAPLNVTWYDDAIDANRDTQYPRVSDSLARHRGGWRTNGGHVRPAKVGDSGVD